MNKEIEKAIREKQKKHPFRVWWSKNDYKVMRIIFFPFWLLDLAYEYGRKWLYTYVIVWNEKRADKILNYFIPRYSDWDPETKTFFFFSNGYGWYHPFETHKLKLRDCLFWKQYGYKIKDYLLNQFELEGFEKTASYDWESDFTEITFKQK